MFRYQLLIIFIPTLKHSNDFILLVLQEKTLFFYYLIYQVNIDGQFTIPLVDDDTNDAIADPSSPMNNEVSILSFILLKNQCIQLIYCSLCNIYFQVMIIPEIKVKALSFLLSQEKNYITYIELPTSNSTLNS